MQPELAAKQRHSSLAAGLGVIVFKGPRGRGSFKEDHNEATGNTWICLEHQQSCVVIIANDVRAERAFPRIA